MDDEDESGISTWQKGVIGFLSFLLLLGLYLYLSGTSLRGLLGHGSSGAGEKVGIVEKLQGRLLRQPMDALEFLDAPVKSDLFTEDTVMTGPSDRATLGLADGGKIELDPGSMIRLSFETSFSLSGIQRKILVDVVSGEVRSSTPVVKIVRRKSAPPAPIRTPPPRPIPSPSRSETPVAVVTEAVPAPEVDVPVEPIVEPPVVEPPLPEPKPTRVPFRGQGLRFASPLDQDRLSLQDGALPPLRQDFRIASSVAQDLHVIAVVKDQEGQQVYRKLAEIRRGAASFSLQFDHPGEYIAEILDEGGKSYQPRNQIHFVVEPRFKVISVLAPLVGGQEFRTNELRGKRLKDYSVQFRWAPLSEDLNLGAPEKYGLRVSGFGGTQLLKQEVEGTDYLIKKGRLSQDKMTYEVFAKLPSGYIATSGAQPFFFSFLSPKQTIPKNGQTVSSSVMGKKKAGGVLFTWQKTSFTDNYDFEIAADAEFSQTLKTVNLKENFVVFRNLRPGEYYWRVRAIGQGVKSPAGSPYRVTVTP